MLHDFLKVILWGWGAPGLRLVCARGRDYVRPLELERVQ